MKIQIKYFLFLPCIILHVYGQYGIGSTNMVLMDSSRSNRNVPIELYYPSDNPGINSQPASGNFPLITFGHGFVMTVDAYYHLKDSLVPKGYVIALVNTEGTFSPSHADFGKDLLFVNNNLKLQSLLNTGFILYQHLSGQSAIGGHSMGGGAAMLAGANAGTGDITTLIGFASAETSPSAIQACSQIQIPTIIFSGQADGVTPPGEHQIPMYDSLNSICKYHVGIIGGSHCYFALPNIACDFGESLVSTGITMSREDQHRVLFRYLNKWCDHYLKNSPLTLNQLDEWLNQDSQITYDKNCEAETQVQLEGKTLSQVKWKIENKVLWIDLNGIQTKSAITIEVQTIAGNTVTKLTVKSGDPKIQSINLSTLSKSLYILTIRLGKQINSSKFALP